MILSCSHLSKSFLEKTILSDGSFHIEDREKAALIGVNGAGKSTLLKMITGDLSPDTGEVTLAKDKKLGYLAQHQVLFGDMTIYERVMETKKDLFALEQAMRDLEKSMQSLSGDALEEALARYARMNSQFEQANGYAVRSEITGVLKGLGFDESEFSKKISSLSGGQKTRAALAALLMEKPDILLLDEPTNHLDMASISWLETYLTNYDGAVLIVSHDRYFLDKVVTKVIEIENAHLTMYSGTYTQFSQKKKQVREAQLKAYMNQQADIKHQEEVITRLRSFNREKSIKRAESREKMLNKIQRIEKPIELDASMQLHLEPAVVSGNDVLSVSGLSKSFGSQLLFENSSFEIKRGEKVAIIGDNGTGKTTMLKILNGLLPADAGTYRLGTNVMIGYYDQEQHLLNPDNTLFEEISDAHPSMTNTEIRNLLAGFLFTGDDVFKKISSLSGGEKGRMSLALLMLSDCNFLILDEPTNHLDMESREVLEQTIRDYTGTLLYVSHDRYFINQTATRILELADHGFTNYLGNYDYYLEKVAQLRTQESNNTAAAAQVTEAKKDWQSAKQAAAVRRKAENDLKKAEEKIASLEARQEELDKQLSDPSLGSNVAKLIELHKERESIETDLAALYESWEVLSEQLENLSE